MAKRGLRLKTQVKSVVKRLSRKENVSRYAELRVKRSNGRNVNVRARNGLARAWPTDNDARGKALAPLYTISFVEAQS